MPDPMPPDCLPATSARFIAYGPSARMADPDGGDPLTIRPQTFVAYYCGILIKDIEFGGRSGDGDVVTVEFDPESVNLSEKISAKIDPDDPLVDYLRSRHGEGKPVDAAIEVIRKKKNASTKDPISPLTPIHALRGAQDASGSKAQTGPSFENTRKMLVMANGRRGKALTSDPAEWSSLVNNKAGDLPPEGWKFYAPGDDWSQIGAITPSDAPPQHATPGGGPGLDTQTLGALFETIINKVLDEREAAAGAAPTGRPVSRKFNEGKIWDVRTNDGRINLGGYAVAAQACTYRWAHKHLAGDSDGTHVDPDAAWSLSDTVMAIADHVQADAYGHGVEPDRTKASHKEAVLWAEWVIDNQSPYPAGDTNTAEWADEVAKEATRHLTQAGERVGAHLKTRAQTAKPQPNPEPDTTSDEPTPTVVNALLDAVTRSWDDKEAIKNLGIRSKERGLGDVKVGVTETDSVPTLQYPHDDESPIKSVTDLLRDRWTELGNGGGWGEPTATSGNDVPSGRADGDRQDANQDRHDGPATTGDSNRGYSVQVADLIRNMYAAESLDDLKAVYGDAKDANLLASSISVVPDDDGRFRYGVNGQEGYEKRTVAQVMEALLARFATDDTAPAEPVAEGEPAETAPDEPDSPSSAAQEFADKIDRTASTLEEIDAAIKQAQDEGLYEDKVVVDERRGALRSYLSSARKAAEKAGR